MDIKRNILKLVVLFIYIGLPFLIFIGLIPFDYKFYTLTIGGIIVYAIMKVLGFKNQELGIVPTLLLHTCCAPCSSAVIERLSKYFQITVFYYNPNIEPEEEYVKSEVESYV